MINILSFILVNSLFMSVLSINWQIDQNLIQISQGCLFNGNDITSVKTTALNCGQQCQNRPDCSHFTWNNNSGGTCWLKFGPISKTLATSTADVSSLCGIVKEQTLLWSEEFNGDLSKWNLAINGNGGGNNELQYYTNTNAQVKNGSLTITLKKESIEWSKYTSSRLVSKNEFKYGVIESRIKVPRASGSWPAFWLLSAHKPLVWPDNGAMDPMGHWGCNPGWITQHCHTKRNYGDNRKGAMHFVNVDDFHTYRLDWNSRRLKYSVDNQVLFIYNNTDNKIDSWPFNSNFNIILNLAYAGQYMTFNNNNYQPKSCSNDLNDNVLPAYLIVDYVRQFAPNIDWQIDANKISFSQGCDFTGNDLASAITTSSNCGLKCKSTPGCTHFSWNSFQGGTCWMKKGSISQNNAKISEDFSSVCGLV